VKVQPASGYCETSKVLQVYNDERRGGIGRAILKRLVGIYLNEESGCSCGVEASGRGSTSLI
jgi:hypothetical protein